MNLLSLFALSLIAVTNFLAVANRPITLLVNQQLAAYIKTVTPQTTISASTSALPTKFTTSPAYQSPSQPKTPWGSTEKIGDHLYRTYVGQDEKMATPDEILQALNTYRQNHGQGTLHKDDKLCAFAQLRADEQARLGNLDSHAGFTKYFEDKNNWQELGITGAGENASQGYTLSGTHLIEWVFSADDEHRSNQLNPNWTLACATVSGSTVDIIFGKR
ncbi:hypothetical protein A2721_02865 [Candidatus Gottesmanbacteria bacterium RIFCSPHIGHO2_01_FULL_47_48]|uniref:SCP domain-containing protein n=1 Tax=Candidatus Gottesmanbacteria bacterium RIFCSPHIGHO2_01_FULL_47_48 TaxID=1798381 RepID=A0A1F6A4T1_9BACT|nr:MAG: hypothetical protein A2721_02865 [Candidatus Gottesmanbacteria bacterium RIFCSPHIGHO2_01_FULL_47_48]